MTADIPPLEGVQTLGWCRAHPDADRIRARLSDVGPWRPLSDLSAWGDSTLVYVSLPTPNVLTLPSGVIANTGGEAVSFWPSRHISTADMDAICAWWTARQADQ